MLQNCQFVIRKNVPKFPMYMVGSDGSLRNVRLGREIKPQITDNGYATQLLSGYVDGNYVRKRFYLHRLVLSTFLGFSYKNYIDHKDDDKLNNSLCNLHWVTQSENVKKAYDRGRAKSPKATTGKFGKLHHASKPISGYDENGDKIISFESICLAKKNGYHPVLNKPNRKSKGLIFKYD